jgi:hypothetical protein
LIAATGDARPVCNFVAIKTTIMATTMTMEESQEYLGTWVSGDGYIQHQLLPKNRYDEARGNRKSAYMGQYWVKEIILNTKMTLALQPMVISKMAYYIMPE